MALGKTKNKKCSAKGKEYVFIGYSNTAKAYRLTFRHRRNENCGSKIFDFLIFCEKTFITKTTKEVLELVVAQNSVSTENKRDEDNVRPILTDGTTDEEYQSSSESDFMGFESDNLQLARIKVDRVVDLK